MRDALQILNRCLEIPATVVPEGVYSDRGKSEKKRKRERGSASVMDEEIQNKGKGREEE